MVELRRTGFTNYENVRLADRRQPFAGTDRVSETAAMWIRHGSQLGRIQGQSSRFLLRQSWTIVSPSSVVQNDRSQRLAETRGDLTKKPPSASATFPPRNSRHSNSPSTKVIHRQNRFVFSYSLEQYFAAPQQHRHQAWFLSLFTALATLMFGGNAIKRNAESTHPGENVTQSPPVFEESVPQSPPHVDRRGTIKWPQTAQQTSTTNVVRRMP